MCSAITRRLASADTTSLISIDSHGTIRPNSPHQHQHQHQHQHPHSNHRHHHLHRPVTRSPASARRAHLQRRSLRRSVKSIKQVGPYAVGDKIGEGSYGAVHVATHLPTGQEVALKFIDRRKIKEKYIHENLEREVSIMQQLEHPFVIKLLQVVEFDDYMCIVTEKAEEDFLTILVDSGVIAEARAKKYAAQLMLAVQHLHQKGIAHRDLKVENMMLDKADHVKLIDFGLSNQLTPAKQLFTTCCGSLAYSAPELLGQKPYSFSVDVWGIGICLYVMLTARLPFHAESLTQLHANILEKNYTLPSSFSDDLKDLITRCFEFRPNKRITLDEMLAHPWAAEAVAEARTRADRLIEIDDEIVKRMTNMGYEEPEGLKESILANKWSSTYVTYHLFKQAKQFHKKKKPHLRATMSLQEIPSLPKPGGPHARHSTMSPKRHTAANANASANANANANGSGGSKQHTRYRSTRRAQTHARGSGEADTTPQSLSPARHHHQQHHQHHHHQQQQQQHGRQVATRRERPQSSSKHHRHGADGDNNNRHHHQQEQEQQHHQQQQQPQQQDHHQQQQQQRPRSGGVRGAPGTTTATTTTAAATVGAAPHQVGSRYNVDMTPTHTRGGRAAGGRDDDVIVAETPVAQMLAGNRGGARTAKGDGEGLRFGGAPVTAGDRGGGDDAGARSPTGVRMRVADDGSVVAAPMTSTPRRGRRRRTGHHGDGDGDGDGGGGGHDQSAVLTPQQQHQYRHVGDSGGVNAPPSWDGDGQQSIGLQRREPCPPRFQRQLVGVVEDQLAVRSLSFHPHLPYVAVGANSQTLRLCSTHAFQDNPPMGDGSVPALPVMLQLKRHHRGSIYSLAWSGDGTMLASGSNDKTAHIMRFDGERCELHSHWDIRPHDGTVRDLCFSQREPLLLTAGAGDCSIAGHDFEQCTTVFKYKGHTDQVSAVSNRGDLVLSASLDSTVRLWDMRQDMCIRTITCKGIPATSAAVNPDASHFAVGLETGVAMLFDLRTGKELKQWVPHQSDCRSVEFSHDAHTVLTGSYDGTARLTAMDDHPHYTPFTSGIVAKHNDKLIQARWHPTLPLIGTTSADHTARFWYLWL